MIILVADDDRLIRFMMKSMLSEILEAEDMILEAVNGKEMVEVCKEKMPDIVFTDIKMPYMNGIDAIEECKKYSEDTEFVVISGYSEFEYAQKALKMSVHDYLLKPVEEEQLRQVVQKLQGKIAGNKKESNSRFQLKIFNMFHFYSTVGIEEEYEKEILKPGFTYEVIGMKSRCPKKNQQLHTEFQKQVIEKTDVLGRELLKKGSCYAQIYSPEGTPYFIFLTTKEGKEELLSYVKKLSWKNKKDKLAFCFIYFSKDNMRDIYCECEKNDNFEGVEMNYQIGAVVDIVSEDISVEGREILKCTYRLLDAWERADAVGYKEVLNYMYRKFKDVETDIHLENLIRYCSVIMQQEIKGRTYKEFCRTFIEIAESMYGNIESEDSDVIERIKAYVEKYYMNDIGIGQIAKTFDITPNYLSTIFHQKAGCKFIDYLTEVRIANAKRLLIQNSTASVKDIAVMVGYNSARYFSVLFQKVVGVKPSTYRKENIAF